MKVRVDHSKCETNALCIGMAPDLFDLDGDYPVQVPDAIPDDRRGEVREIVASCPTAALSIEFPQDA
ncbi:ferredoxin [Mycolicibacterium moriokaense]|uniref:Ferredoxin n=1 Tax=Mycolicibacterium moriokaense TaxID=39691 RepID=A0A318H9W1_9MYCO|nr:ferredoxin [Mycolicibacterium moriokaense]PXX03273.1 ferredoxin [Mycolicibacterium moriokaense]